MIVGLSMILMCMVGSNSQIMKLDSVYFITNWVFLFNYAFFEIKLGCVINLLKDSLI